MSGSKSAIIGVLAIISVALVACGEPTTTPTPPTAAALAPTNSAAATTAPQATGTVEMQATAVSATRTPQLTPTNRAVLSPTAAPSLAPTTAPAMATAASLNLQLASQVVSVPQQWRKGVFEQERRLNVPQGFQISVYASGLQSPRLMAYSPDGDLYATVTSAGRVVRLADKNNDGVADDAQTFAEGLNGPHGIAFRDGWVYIGNYDQVIRLKDTNGDGRADQKEIVVADLPKGGGHATRTIGFGPDGKLYVAAGSSCNVCEETDPRRAAISVYDADGKNGRVYASGLRNAVGFVWQPGTSQMYGVVNNRDNLGDDTPPEIAAQVTDGANFGWPYCYGDRIWDKDFGKKSADYCASVTLPAIKMQAHSAPLGLRFYDGTQFPAALQGALFMGFHGSWNRSTPTGYKVVYAGFDPTTKKPLTRDGTKDFVTGWLPAATGSDSAWGRPVDVIVAKDGSLLISDDRAGAIYRVAYTGK